MTEHFGFFDAIQDSNGHYDREYNAQQWNEPFRALVTTGVMKGAYNQLEVTVNGANMVSTVKSGIAFIEGRFYFNDALVDLTHDTEVMGLSRIDRIVVRMDSRTEARHVKTFIKKGVPAASPVPPVLTQTQQLYEISLAQVRVVGGQTYIAANGVTDERGKDVICPWAGSNILPNFNADGLAQLIAEVESLSGDVMLENGKSVQFLGDYNTVVKSGYYNGSATFGATNLPPGSSSSYLVEVIAWSGYNNGSITQIARDSNNPWNPWFRQGFSGGASWNPWTRPINANGSVIYINPTLGTDAPDKGWGPNENAFKTASYAVNSISKFNLRDVTVNLAAGTYPQISLGDFIGARINMKGAGTSLTTVHAIDATNCDSIMVQDLGLTRGLDFRNVGNFLVQSITKDTSYNNHGLYCLGSKGAVFSSRISNCVSMAGIKADNGSDIMLDSITGTGNGIGIEAEVSVVRRRSTTITGTTPTRAVNGGQIL